LNTTIRAIGRILCALSVSISAVTFEIFEAVPAFLAN